MVDITTIQSKWPKCVQARRLLSKYLNAIIINHRGLTLQRSAGVVFVRHGFDGNECIIKAYYSSNSIRSLYNSNKYFSLNMHYCFWDIEEEEVQLITSINCFLGYKFLFSGGRVINECFYREWQNRCINMSKVNASFKNGWWKI